nr:GntR family transcriptional regulator [Rhodococcus sp. (in: high G+C Gram-positive bacteria)]
MSEPGTGHVDARYVRDIVELWSLGEQEGASSRLPSEDVLTKLFATNRGVVREALTLLAQAGRVDRRRGVGTSWAPAAPVFDTSSHTEDRGSELISEILKWTVLDTVPPRTQMLTPTEDPTCLFVEVRNWRRGRVAAVGSLYVRGPEHRSLVRDSFRSDLVPVLAAAGVTLASSETVIRAVLADSVDRSLMSVALGAPLIRTDTVVSNASGEHVFSAHSRGHDAYRMVSDV